jgi:pseudaminic acid synthase
MKTDIGNKIEIESFIIDKDSSTFIIAELSANHGNKIKNAINTIRAAKSAGANAIKLQTYTADTITIDHKNEYFQIKDGTIWDGRYLYDLYREAQTPWEWHEELFHIAREEGLICFSSPFDITAVDFLKQFNPPAYKIASFEITDIPLIEYVAKQGKPIIISTGIATQAEIFDAVETCRNMNNNDIILLKCTSAYPSSPEEINLLTIPDLSKQFNVFAGLSDHTLGSAVPVGAIAFGAKVIEKHFILDKKIGGPDASFSMEPYEFSKMVKDIRIVEKAIGEVTYNLSGKTIRNRKFARSLFVVKEMKAGEQFTRENIRSIRPGNGLSPKYLKDVIGKKAKEDIAKGTPLNWDLVST